MTYRVRALTRARQDVDAILDWLIHERKTYQGARNWLDAYDKATDSLTRFPERCGFALENDYATRELRQFLFRTRHGGVYRGIFTIEADEVLILRVRGPGEPQLRDDEL